MARRYVWPAWPVGTFAVRSATSRASVLTLSRDRLNDATLSSQAASVGVPDKIYGEDGADKLLGFDGNDEIHGGAGNDNVRGGAGNDALYGEAGKDRFECGPGTDTIIDFNSSEGDTKTSDCEIF